MTPKPNTGHSLVTLAQATLVPVISETSKSSEILYEGWLLKKRRKKMQGYARRYFVLNTNGTLAYSIKPNDRIRDQIRMNHATLSSSPKTKAIHIDSGTGTFHTRALTQQDFDLWMTAFRRFISLSRPLAHGSEGTVHHVGVTGTVNFHVGHAAKMNSTLEDMQETIGGLKQLIEIYEDISLADPGKAATSRGSRDERPFLGIFHKKRSTASSLKQADGDEVAGIEKLRNQIATLERQHRSLTSTFGLMLHAPGPLSRQPLQRKTAELQEAEIRSIKSIGRLTSSWRGTSIDSGGDDSVQWFDAQDGPEEFVLEPEQDIPEPPEEQASDTESDEIFETPIEKPSQITFKRRTALPAKTSGDEASLFSVLKQNIGKDLSTIALPVSFNEPISMLQRLAEDLEYASLLDEAAATKDSTERMSFVAAFVVSGYCCTRLRASRKPFMPMLGETFEDTRANFIAEKVSHNPSVMACHAQRQGWTYDSVTQAKQKFWGRSLEIIPVGNTTLKIAGETYSWQRPSSFMRNVMAGTKYLEHVGTVTITNHDTKARCEIEFREAGLWGSPNVVAGVAYSPRGQVESKLEGKWHEQFARILSRNQLQVLWRANEFPADAQDYYGFSAFTITLNELTEDLILRSEQGDITGYRIPATDSRFRPDQRALEEGRVEDADREKVRVEDLQRARRRAGKDAQPKWFRKSGAEDTDWEYGCGYWEQRSDGWQEDTKLW